MLLYLRLALLVTILFGELEQHFTFSSPEPNSNCINFMHHKQTMNLHISRINVSNLCYSLQTTMCDCCLNRFKAVSLRFFRFSFNINIVHGFSLLMIDKFISFFGSSDANFIILPWILHSFFKLQVLDSTSRWIEAV